MTSVRRQLARQALNAALNLRKNNVGNLVDPICVYDLAEKLGIEVRFADIPSLEGMYSSAPRPAIILGAERPAGRRVYTCGHELGHHVFGHGTRVDELRPDGSGSPLSDPEEFLAQSFSGFLLMPKLAICKAFTERGWKPTDITPEQIYRISNRFGVTYSALVHHMGNVLGLLSEPQSARLLDVKLKDIRAPFISDARRHLVFVDTHWTGRAIDLEVEDVVLAPLGVDYQGSNLRHIGRVSSGDLFEAYQPGRGQFSESASGWANYIRVSSRFFVGRSVYRHFEEVRDE